MSQHPINNNFQALGSQRLPSFFMKLVIFSAFFITALSSINISHLKANSVAEYVYEYDSTYAYTIEKKSEHSHYTIYTVNLKSQRWRKAPEVENPVWSHTLYVVVPHTVKAAASLLIVQGGSTDDKKEEAQQLPSQYIIDTALQTKSIVSTLTDIPNQPVHFIDEKDSRYIEKGRKEDALVAYSWDKYMKTADPRWSVRLPMAKAIVKAMDTLQDISSKYLDNHPFIQRFILTGKSKRGWAAWLAASVDSRIEAIIPVCTPLEEISEGLKRQKRAYGQWSSVIKDYLDLSIHEKLDTQPFKELMKIESPFFTARRVMIPKYIIEASGDEFFLPDSSNFYRPALLGETHFLTVPNSGHNIADNLYWPTLTYYYSTLLYQNPLPQVKWERRDSILSVEVDRAPHKITIWTAYNESGRDFRHKVLQDSWKPIPINPDKNETVYNFPFTAPDKGWAASFVELQFKERGKIWKCTSPVIILPDTYPYQDSIE